MKTLCGKIITGDMSEGKHPRYGIEMQSDQPSLIHCDDCFSKWIELNRPYSREFTCADRQVHLVAFEETQKQLKIVKPS